MNEFFWNVVHSQLLMVGSTFLAQVPASTSGPTFKWH